MAASGIAFLGNLHHPSWADTRLRIEKLLEYPAAYSLLMPQLVSKYSLSLYMIHLDPAQ
jgi:hypothetical protein